MASTGDLINFDVIESHKENIQALPSGRSARKLAELYSPSPSHKLSTPTPADTRNVNDCIRAKYEDEIETSAESDDPLDVYDRYVRWTFDAYPSAQATPASQLHTLLERATKSFINSQQYKNDPRYLKLWLHYIHFFSDAPRETYVFLSRHSIGETLALFYEEYAEWLEGAGRWSQAEEVYKLGIEREARPVQRLMRKFKEFEARQAQHPEAAVEPSSPALPSVRPVLAAKMNPFGGAAAAASRPADPQAPRPGSGGVGGAPKTGKPKMAIFSDADAQPSGLSARGAGSKGWDTIDSMRDRKKENTVEPTPWVGETLKAGGKKPAAAKMAVFRDASLAKINNVIVVPSTHQVTVHPQTGKRECIFVDLAAVYPTPEEPGTERSFEEIMAAHRGWLSQTWDDEVSQESGQQGYGEDEPQLLVEDQEMPPERLPEIDMPSHDVGDKLVIHHDEPVYDENGNILKPVQQNKAHKKKKVMEMNETQIIKAKLDSPSGPKMKKKGNSEPTMTLHTRAATDDIYDIFNAPLKPSTQAGEESGEEEDDYTDGDYTTDGESNGPTRQVDVEEKNEDEDEEDEEDAKSVSEWSDFSTRRHIPDVGIGDDTQRSITASQVLDVGVPDGEVLPENDEHGVEEEGQEEEEEEEEDEDYSLPHTRTTFVPLPPEDYEPRTHPFRDAAEMANNRLPFMTPITERTELSLDMGGRTGSTERFKTPCKPGEQLRPFVDPEDEPMSSPLREIVNEERAAPPAAAAKPLSTLKKGVLAEKPPPSKGPIIKDLQCNPVDTIVRDEILSKLHPPLASYDGFFDHSREDSLRGAEIRRYTKTLAKTSRSSADKNGPIPAAVTLEFPDVTRSYQVRRELGAGAFAPVYLVQNSQPDNVASVDGNDENAAVVMGKGVFATRHRSETEALKMELPPTPWEFYMMRLAHSRLGPQHRATASLSHAREFHLYRDEAFLFLPYHPHGTLLDVVNFFRAEPSGVMEEQLSMFFTIELLRTVEALHSKNLLHGDLKPDNCLLRIDSHLAASHHGHQPEAASLGSQYSASGSNGWSSWGLTLIDFGRAIDMRNFVSDVAFIADWKTTAQDCAEMREGRPWTWQIDYHGLAGTIHCLLFGKYIETVRVDQGGIGLQGRKYKIRESLKRYWQTEVWADCFDMLLNPGATASAVTLDGGDSGAVQEDGAKMPLVKNMRRVRERMETWLETSSERGTGLKNLLSRLEAHVTRRQ